MAHQSLLELIPATAHATLPSQLCADSIQEVFSLIGMLEKVLVPTNCYQLQFNGGGCFEDSAWSFNRLEDWMALLLSWICCYTWLFSHSMCSR